MQYPREFGAAYSAAQTRFTLWAPDMSKAMLRLYTAGSEEEAPWTAAQHLMKPEEDGVFSCTVKGDLHGMYYDFLLTDAKRRTCVSADPWARACGLNGLRSMVVDLSRTDPDGWSTDRFSPAAGAPVIYETHVCDFSWDESSGVPREWRGKYLAFTAGGAQCGSLPTCTDYLKRLGVTHVQLQPISDFASVREDKPVDYNWGYDMLNYNVPEGSYATDAAHGEVRIRECKQMVQALHRAGIGVVMDVVYNHTYLRHSWLDRTAPGRYYRHAADGSHLNGSGCGNETASESPAFRNYMIQSILYWAKEYHIDGFRFDLMGVHDTEVMNEIRKALDTLPGGRHILLYGEPWAGGAIGLKAPHMAANKEHMKLLDERIGCFSDDTRDSLAGGPFNPCDAGYGSGNTGKAVTDRLKHCIRGLSGKDDPLRAPSQAVHYVSCHDNYTLWDRLTLQTGSQDFEAMPDLLLKRMKLISGLYLSCLGLAFLQEGEEFCRTKYGDGNSYQGPAQVNRLDWYRASRCPDMIDWYRGLIGLRREMITDLSLKAAESITFFDERPDGSFAFLRRGGAGSRFACYLTYVNPTDRPHAKKLPDGIWAVLCDGIRSDLWRDSATQAEDPIIIPPYGFVILAK